jgi:hypothetical protein
MRSLLLVISAFLYGCGTKDGVVFHAVSKDGLYECMFVHKKEWRISRVW